MKTDGQQLRTGFDREAARYNRVRPAPPPALVGALLERLGSGDRVLEVGCGTGQATRPLAEHGLRVHALELGPNLAALARRNLSSFPHVTVQTEAFEVFRAAYPFGALVSVQAFHWVGPGRGLALAASALRRGGHLLLAWHQDRSQDTPFYEATNPIYQRYPAPPRPTPLHSAGAFEEAVAASPHFTNLETLRFSWRRRYSGRDYLDLLLTTSDVQAFGETNRRDFLSEIALVIDRHGGEVERHYESVLLRATRSER